MGVLNTFFVRYGCLEYVFCTLWMSRITLLYVMDVSNNSFERYKCLKYVFCTLWMSREDESYTNLIEFLILVPTGSWKETIE